MILSLSFNITLLCLFHLVHGLEDWSITQLILKRWHFPNIYSLISNSIIKILLTYVHETIFLFSVEKNTIYNTLYRSPCQLFKFKNNVEMSIKTVKIWIKRGILNSARCLGQMAGKSLELLCLNKYDLCGLVMQPIT